MSDRNPTRIDGLNRVTIIFGIILFLLLVLAMGVMAACLGLTYWRDDTCPIWIRLCGIFMVVFAIIAVVGFYGWCLTMFDYGPLKSWLMKYLPRRNTGFDPQGYPTDPSVKWFWGARK